MRTASLGALLDDTLKAFGWVVLIAGIALESPATVHLGNVTFQKPLIEKLFAANRERSLTKYLFPRSLSHLTVIGLKVSSV